MTRHVTLMLERSGISQSQHCNYCLHHVRDDTGGSGMVRVAIQLGVAGDTAPMEYHSRNECNKVLIPMHWPHHDMHWPHHDMHWPYHDMHWPHGWWFMRHIIAKILRNISSDVRRPQSISPLMRQGNILTGLVQISKDNLGNRGRPRWVVGNKIQEHALRPSRFPSHPMSATNTWPPV